MRVRLSGSTITAHGDSLGTPYVEFYGNEPLGFPTNWTVSGSAPDRVLLDPAGRWYSPELPTQTAPNTGGDSGVITTDGTTTLTATTLTFPAGSVSDEGGGVAAVAVGSPVLVATTLLSSAQILAMHDTPVELVPAPGAGKAIAVINIAAALAFATTSYETGEDLDITYDGDANTLAPTVFTAFLTADAAGGGEFATGPQRSTSTFVGLLTAAEDKAIVATCLPANPENGDSDVFVTILYAVVDLA